MSLSLGVPTSQLDSAGTFSSQIARRLSKRLSLSGGSRRGANKEAATSQGEETFSPHFTFYESNEDIRRGPITHHRSGRSTGQSRDINNGVATALGSGAVIAGATSAMEQSQGAAGQRDTGQDDTGQARLLGEGSSSHGGLTQPVSGKDFSNIDGSDENNQVETPAEDSIAEKIAVAAGIVGGASLVASRSSEKSSAELFDQELKEQSRIDSDVFVSAPWNEAAARGLSGDKATTEATHAPKDTWQKTHLKKASRTEQGKTRKSDRGLSSAAGLGVGAAGAGVLGAGALETRGGSKQDANKGVLRRGGSSRGENLTREIGTDPSTRLPKTFGGSGYNVNTLEERIQAVGHKCKTQLGLSTNEISKRSPTVDAFFDAVAAQRLRWMPHDGSKLDCSLRWASRLAYAVDALRRSVNNFAPRANEAARLIWGFEALLLESDVDNTDVFESIFGRYGRAAVGIYLLLQYESAYRTSPALQPQAVAVYADLLEMVCSTTASCIEGFKCKEPEQSMGHHVDTAFLTYAKRYATHWNDIVESYTSKLVNQSSLISSSPEMGSLRQFLAVQDRPLQFILDSRSHSLADGSFEWFSNVLYDFTVGKSPMMLVNGEPGSGKSAMAQWIVERLQESAEYENWNVIPYTIRADVPVSTLPLAMLKGIIHQILDQSVNDNRTQEAILVQVAKAASGALNGAGETEVEDCLWRGIQIGLDSKFEFMFVIDGFDQIRGGDSDAVACLDHFAELLSKQDVRSKMIACTRPLTSKMRLGGVFQLALQPSQTCRDLRAYVLKLLSRSHFEGLGEDQMDSAVSVIVNRSQGSFSWAEMAVEYAKDQRTLNQAVSFVQALPQSMSELVDFHMKSLDLKSNETKCIMAWLAVAERPLLVEEIEQLLAVDPKRSNLTSPPSQGENQWSTGLSPLVMTREGVVSFAHTCIRDHVIKQASSSSKSLLNLKKANYDLLTRCLGWVQLNVREEAGISMDKLTMDERNRLFDKYPVLEYTARYWISHLLSSDLVTEDGQSRFSASFNKLVPATVLFARIELTCKESQFTRSSVVELYRLVTDIRRLVLGHKSLAFLQSLILSACVSRLAHASHADDHCYEAWKLSQQLLGQSDAITQSCAEMLTQSFTERTTLTSQQEDIMKHLILTESGSTGVEFNQRLKYLGLIVGFYKARGDHNSALLVSRKFYHQIIRKYGTNSRQSSETADFLAGQFPTIGSDEMSRDIAKTKYDNLVRTRGVTDDRRIKHSLYMAQRHEQQGEKAQALAVLSSLWAGLHSRDRDINSVDMMDKKANVALVYYQFLRRQGQNDEAENIIRELVADLEVHGVHSKEMMQRVNLLRAETREMQMYSLDQSLAVLMWHYYKETNQEYSSEAQAFAMMLAKGMANNASKRDSTLLPDPDRKLMVELLDSITSSTGNLSVSTLVLCYSIASIYVRVDDWAAASACSKAVLQHVWPTVEQAGSHKDFTTDLAPPVVDIALVLAYCHFRQLRLEEATIVYENAFGALILTNNVPVPSVLAVAKAVVEFFETTFQFIKAFTLLHTVSSFLTSRLGETHKHTIDNRYLEAALAHRLEMYPEAKNTYQHIYENTLQGKTIDTTGFDAAIALTALYEKELQWESALDVYRHLWPALIVPDNMQNYDRSQVERLLEKTYLGYMSIMTSQKTKTDFTEQYQIASDYVMTCRNVYGPKHQKTLSATLLLAELCENSDSHMDQAISLYKMSLQTNEWVPTSQSSKGLDQMTQPLPITLKHKLAELFVRKRDSTSEARSLYTEEYQLAKKTQGYFSATTLSWLRELALAHSRQGTAMSNQQGNALLHAHITDALHDGGDTHTMSGWAGKIAAIYLECGFIEGGNSILDELRQRVVNGSDTSTMPLTDRRDAVFVAGFEEVFARRASSNQILSELAREKQIQQAFSKNLSGHDFIPTLISGYRLVRLQKDQERTRAARDTQVKLYDCFCNTLSADNIAQKDIVKQFFEICLREVRKSNYNNTILTTTSTLIRDLCNSSRFQDASDLTGILHSFLHLTDGLSNTENIIAATKIPLYLSGHEATKCPNENLHNEISIKSKFFLAELMESSKAIGLEIIDLPFTQLNDIITLLGEYEMFDDLEAILTQLWTSRIVQQTWTPEVVVWIGRRLVETRFCRGAVDSSIQLCRDICYNLRQVWGSCDSITLEMTKFLSGLFTASGNHQAAALLHESILVDLLNDPDSKDHPQAATIALQHMELLRRAQARLGMEKSPSQTRARSQTTVQPDLVSQVTERFGLKSSQIEGVGDQNGGEQFGVWSKPRRFSIDVQDLDDQEQSHMHRNHLRESTGVGLLDGNGAPRRLSVQAL